MPAPVIAAGAAGAAGAGAGASAGMSAGMSAGIGAAASGFDSILGAILGGLSLRYQREAFEQQRADQRFYWEQSLPKNVMNQRLMAGLNPYADFATPNVSQPVSPQGIPESLGIISNSLSRGAQNALNIISQRIAFKQLELQEKSLDNETKLADARSKLLGSQNLFQELVNWVKDQTKENDVNISNATLESLLADNLNKSIRNEYLPEQLSKDMDLLLEQIYSLRTTNKFLPQKIRSEIGASNASAELARKQVEKIGEEITSLKFDNSAINALDEYVKKLDKDGSASPALKGLIKLGIELIKIFSKRNK